VARALLFLVKHEGGLVDGGVAEHVEWILQKKFKTVEEWLGPEGKKLPAEYVIELADVYRRAHGQDNR
jgi:hypothetical protein